MAIIRWDPFRDLVTLREKMNRLFEDAVSSRGEEKDVISSSWSPAVDIYETEHELVLSAEVPGIHEKDIEKAGEHAVHHRPCGLQTDDGAGRANISFPGERENDQEILEIRATADIIGGF